MNTKLFQKDFITTQDWSVEDLNTNGTYSAGVAGIPTLGFGPMEERYVHTPQDQVDLEKLLKGAMFYALLPVAYSLLRLAGSGVSI